MLGLQTGLQRIVGSHALRGVCALQAAQRDAIVGLQNGACGQFDVFQQRQVGGAGNGERWFVLAKDMERNELIVTQGADHPLLYSKNALGTDATWISGEAPAGEFDCTCKYRYRQPDQAVHVSVRENGQVLVTAKERQRAVTPGQSMVFYQGAVCLGGAICDTVLDAGQVG